MDHFMVPKVFNVWKEGGLKVQRAISLTSLSENHYFYCFEKNSARTYILQVDTKSVYILSSLWEKMFSILKFSFTMGFSC